MQQHTTGDGRKANAKYPSQRARHTSETGDQFDDD
jgi:hypothetical protein